MNTTYKLQEDGSYKKVTLIEKEVNGVLTLTEDIPLAGATGATGSTGRNGIHGLDGLNGTSGTSGTSGQNGLNGINGLDGLNGTSGTSGVNGLNGINGLDGLNGLDGKDGLDGTSGTSGLSGTSGSSGVSGSSGTSGVNGLPGLQGMPGVNGTSGVDGLKGATGATGSAGRPGEKGERGFPGMPGAPGRDGGAYQLRFVDKPTIIPTGYEQVAKDLYIVDTLTVEGYNRQYNFGSASFTNEALLNVKEDIWLDGTLNVFGNISFDIPVDIKHYGSWFDTTTQPNSLVFNIVTLSNQDIEDGVKLVDGSKITFTKSGVYNIQFSAQVVKTDSGSDNIDIWIAKNGLNIDWSNTTVELVGNNTEYVASWNWYVEVVKDDYIQIRWHSDDSNMMMLARPAQPGLPAIPSVILTVQQV